MCEENERKILSPNAVLSAESRGRLRHEEECEIRALLSMKRANGNIQKLGQYEDKSYYFDLPINENCIKRVILGPEFMDEEIEELRALNGSISLDRLQIEKSIGTNIITNR